MIILDTNVISALMRRPADESVVAWLDRQPRTSIWTNAITVLEIRYGLQTMPLGKRRSGLLQAFETLVSEKLAQRIVPFDTAAAQQSADLMARRQKQGRTAELRDSMIAGIALASHATLVTRNTVHFDDLSIAVVNPWMA